MHWACFLLLEAASLVLLFRLNPYQQSIWFSKANTVAGWMAEGQHQIEAYINLGDENQKLLADNLRLQAELETMRQRMTQAQADTTIKTMTDSLDRQDFRLIPARVVDNSVRQRDNIMVINRGSIDGVQPEMGVVCGGGVVGIIGQVGSRFSTVLPILNQHSSISCRIRGTNYFGYLRWHGGDAMKAAMEDVPRHARIRVGDRVETSGYSNIFPGGILIGKVEKVGNSPDGLAFELTIALNTDLGNVEHVAVMDGAFRSEIKALDKKAAPDTHTD